MLTPERALRLNIDNGKPLPKVPGLSALYIAGTVPRHGEVVMIAGRSGAMKSMFALWFADELALPVLYISADMSPFTATVRVAQKRLHITDAMVEHKLRRNEAGQFIDPESVEEVETELRKSRVQFSFGSPITWTRIEEELDAYVEVHDEYPAILVIDNLMDFEYAETDYHVQSGVMQGCTEMARDTGISPWVLHHATDKSDSARTDPYNPPARFDIKNGLAEKPEMCLGIAYDDRIKRFKIATLKQRMGRSDPSGRNFVSIDCEPEYANFKARSLD